MQRLLSTLLVLLTMACGTDLNPASPEPQESAARSDALDFEIPGDIPIFELSNACGNHAVTPVLQSSAIMSPTALLNGGAAPAYWNPNNGRLDRGGIAYVSGGGIRLELATDGCTYVKEVRLGSQVITPTYTNGWWYSSQSSIALPTNTTTTGYNLWVFFPQASDGASASLTVTFGRTYGSGTTTYTLPVVRVESVEAANVDAPIGISRAELMNMFAKSIYANFNGAANSAIITSSDGSQHRIYGYNPASLAISVNSSNGVAFTFDFYSDIPNWCDPRITVSGSFDMLADSAGLRINWRNAPHASAHWPSLCSAVQLIPFLGLIPNWIYGIVESTAAGSVRSSVESAVAASLPTGSGANLFFNGSSVRNNELVVNLKFAAPSIKLRPAYQAFEPGFAGTWFPPGEVLTLAASGLGVNDYVANVSPTTTLYAGPNGVPLFTGNPTPRLQTLARSGALVWPGRPVAELLLRKSSLVLASSSTFAYEPGCSIASGSSSPLFGRPALNFGVNDTAADATRLRGIFGAAPGYHVRVIFLNELGQFITDRAPRCKVQSTGGVLQ